MPKFEDFSKEAKGLCTIVALMFALAAGSLTWAYSTFTPRTEFDEHKSEYDLFVANTACQAAVQNYIAWQTTLQASPNNHVAQRKLAEAKILMDRVCAKGS